jgi:hypothetical protein
MNFIKKIMFVLTLAMFSYVAQAAPMGDSRVTIRPLSDFLDKQGSTANFFNPVPDYVGWTDNPFEKFALVDYAGLANQYLADQHCGNVLGTKVVGNIRQRELADGKAEISVKLETQNALGFAQSGADLAANNWNFNATGTIFGNKTQDVCGGAAAAVGSANLNVTFTIGAPGADLPDLVDVIFNNPAAYKPVAYKFRAIIKDGSNHLQVHQQGETDEDGNLIFTEEIVNIK